MDVGDNEFPPQINQLYSMKMETDNNPRGANIVRSSSNQVRIPGATDVATQMNDFITNGIDKLFSLTNFENPRRPRDGSAPQAAERERTLSPYEEKRKKAV